MKKRIAGGEASFSVGWVKPDQKPPKSVAPYPLSSSPLTHSLLLSSQITMFSSSPSFSALSCNSTLFSLQSHRQAPGGNSSLSISWDTPLAAADSTLTEDQDLSLSLPLSVFAEPVPFSIGVIAVAHCSSLAGSSPSHPCIVTELLPILLASLTAAGVSHTNIFLETISSLTAVPFTALKLRSRVDGILVFSISLVDPQSPQRDLAGPVLEALQQLSQRHAYPGLVPGLVTCSNSPEALLEMRGVMKHVTRDWAAHLLATLALSRAPQPFLPSPCSLSQVTLSLSSPRVS
jgi:hypothetical protein